MNIFKIYKSRFGDNSQVVIKADLLDGEIENINLSHDDGIATISFDCISPDPQFFGTALCSRQAEGVEDLYGEYAVEYADARNGEYDPVIEFVRFEKVVVEEKVIKKPKPAPLIDDLYSDGHYGFEPEREKSQSLTNIEELYKDVKERSKKGNIDQGYIDNTKRNYGKNLARITKASIERDDEYELDKANNIIKKIEKLLVIPLMPKKLMPKKLEKFPCDASNQIDGAGKVCGGRSATVRPGGRNPNGLAFYVDDDPARGRKSPYGNQDFNVPKGYTV